MYLLLEEVQGQGRSDESRAIPSQGEAGQVRRVRQNVSEQQFSVRAPEVGALQAQVRVPHLPQAHGYAGESGSTSEDAAREARQDRVRRVRQDLHEEGLVQEAHGRAHGMQTVLVYNLQQTVCPKIAVATALAHSHRQATVCVRHLRQSVHAKAGSDLSQENSSRHPSALARHADRRHRQGIYRGIRAGERV